jgi:hypothetical protein
VERIAARNSGTLKLYRARGDRRGVTAAWGGLVEAVLFAAKRGS